MSEPTFIIPETFHIKLESEQDSSAQKTINRKLDKIMALLDDLQAQVARQTEVTTSAIKLLEGLKKQIDDAGTDPVKLAELSKQLGDSTDALAAAVAQNTPAQE